MESPDVRSTVDLATGKYTDLDTGEVRTWWQQRVYIDLRMRRHAKALAGKRQVNSDMQNLWGRKPLFVDDWYNGYIPEYRLPNLRADLTDLESIYGGEGPYPDGPLPS